MQFNRFQTLSDIFILIGLVIIGSLAVACLFALLTMPYIHLSFIEILGLAKSNADPKYVPYIKLFTTVTAFGTWVLSAWVLLRIKGKSVADSWQIKAPQPSGVLMFLPILFLALIFASAFLLNLNAQLPLPESIKHFTSQENKKMMEDFLRMDNTNQLMVNLLMIALAPALFEEIFFRGTLQRLLIELFGNVHYGILFCSFTFAAIHLNAEQFIPMFFLALVLGYVCYYSRSIWPSVILHFLNNGFAVFVTYYQHQLPVAKAIAADNYTPPVVTIVLAFMVIGGFFYWLIKKHQILNTPTYE
ncbi:MAG: CPBP family intramembrane metalloprotease [bacterium]|nr:CPBP family intramembrane metalloprotease [bacterium]